jgi:hypothetical protein
MEREWDALLPTGWSAVVSRRGGNGEPAELRVELRHRGELQCLVAAVHQPSAEVAKERVRRVVRAFLDRHGHDPSSKREHAR